MGYSPLWMRRVHVRAAGRGISWSSIAEALVRHDRPAADRRLASMSMTAVVLLAMIFAGGTIWFEASDRGDARFLRCSPCRACCRAWRAGRPRRRGIGRQRHRHSVRRAGWRARPSGRLCAGLLGRPPLRMHGAFYFLAVHDPSPTSMIVTRTLFVRHCGTQNPNRAPGDRGPRRDVRFDQAQQRRQRDAEQAERDDRHEHLVDLERAGGAHDQIADAGDRGVEVGQHHADHAAADREPDAGDDERQRAGSTMLAHNCRSEQRNARPTSSSLGSTDFTP